MNLDTLISGLQHANPAVRLDVVRVLGMVDEVRALEPLRARFALESDEIVRQAIGWAGKRLYDAQQAGYSTLNEIFRHFGIDRELEQMPDAIAAEMERKLQDQLASDVHRMQISAHKKQVGLSAAAGLGIGILGGGMMGISAAVGGMSAGASVASSSLGEERPHIGTSRTPPTAPTNSDITVWARRLREGKLPGQREEAVIELAGLNNLAALPHLAAAFVTDPAPQVREAAQRFGKIMYWNSIYWDMERDGTLRQEMNLRMEAMGKRIENGTGTLRPITGALRPITGPVNPGTGTLAPGGAAAGQEGVTGEPEVDVAEILRRAQEDRERRKRK